MSTSEPESTAGGDLVGRVLDRQGVRFLFTLCGGHIAPVLVGARRYGIRIVDVRDEATAVFAADAVARLSGTPGVAAVTAGPGVTNAVTAVKNAQLAHSPVVLLGGAAPTMLKGRGALQDIDQLALMAPHVKHATSVRRVRDLVPRIETAFRIARDGVPGPVFVECPVDLLYDEAVVRGLYDAGALSGFMRWYVNRHLRRTFAGVHGAVPTPPAPAPADHVPGRAVRRAAALLRRAERPALLIGSQSVCDADPQHAAGRLAEAVERLQVPTYLSGMARGLLGRAHPLLFRHARRRALRDADLVVLAGVPCDFRLDYGRHINRDAVVVAANRSSRELRMNRRPALAALTHPAGFLRALATEAGALDRPDWLARLRARDTARDDEIRTLAAEPTDHVNPLALLLALDGVKDDGSVIVLDGGDFAASASYVVLPDGPLAALDPGAFGTLGVGAGFALGAGLVRPDAEIWILYGDGSAAFSLAEFDSFVRHRVPVIAVVGNDAAWTQIRRAQREILRDDTGTVLRRTDYERVAEGYGGKGLRIECAGEIDTVLRSARTIARSGVPVLVNALIGTTDFRKGSVSL